MSEKTQEQTEAIEKRIKTALRDPGVPKTYTNSFILRLSNADVSIVLSSNDEPAAVVNMSYTLAKTLSQRLGLMLARFEARTEREMLTTDQVDTALQKMDEPTDDPTVN